jgi:hypothetical protein
LSPDQRFFFLTPPAFDLSCGRNRVSDPLRFLRIDELYRTPASGVTGEYASLMLTNPLLKVAARGSDVIGAIGTQQYVQIRGQRGAGRLAG